MTNKQFITVVVLVLVFMLTVNAFSPSVRFHAVGENKWGFCIVDTWTGRYIVISRNGAMHRERSGSFEKEYNEGVK